MPQRFLRFSLILLASVAALAFLADAAGLMLAVPRNPNEGWNAYYAVAAYGRHAWPLYPHGLMFNNYPPLSYFIVGVLARLCGDAIVAGRLVSLGAALAIAAALYRAARLMGCGRLAGAAGALLFLASPWALSKFAGMDDPQLLGNFLDALGLVVLLRRPGDGAHVVGAALLLTLAEFVKPLFIDLPLALLIWLALYQRRSAVILAVSGLGFALLGLAAARMLLGGDLLAQIFAPRRFSIAKMFGQPGQWLLCEFLPFGMALVLLGRNLRARAPDRFAVLVGLYALIAFGLMIGFSGGAGVSASPALDASMAAALAAALFLDRGAMARLPSWLCGAAALISALLLVLSFAGRWTGGPTLAALLRERGAARADIADIARQRGPVLCDDLALCYWAGKPPEITSFNLTQAILTGRQSQAGLIGRIAARDYAMIQISAPSSLSALPAVTAALAQNDRAQHKDVLGTFWTPRSAD